VNALCFPEGGKAIIVLAREVQQVRIRVHAEPVRREADCVDFVDRTEGRGVNPRVENGHRFTVHAAGGGLASRGE
jgi:hypothetical protein